MSSIVERLTEGVVNRDMRAESHALLSKWKKTGLLEGLDSERQQNTMSRLLENQAKELLREQTTIGAGSVEGFAAVAFPIVRRVFAGLIANDLVSVQPMSLPSGLIFFLDFTFSGDAGGTDGGMVSPRMGNTKDKSIYGTDQVGAAVIDGVDLVNATNKSGFSGPGRDGQTGYAYASPSGSLTDPIATSEAKYITFLLDGAVSQANKKRVLFDPDLLSVTDSSLRALVVDIDKAQVVSATGDPDFDNLSAFVMDLVDFVADFDTGVAATTNVAQLRRLTTLVSATEGLNGEEAVRLVLAGPVASIDTTVASAIALDNAIAAARITFPVADKLAASSVLGAVGSSSNLFPMEAETDIPEIDIKVDSTAITAQTKKLKAKWTPELGQDLNAYHNLDAEVELTSILSEQIALEIDREILADLVNGATAATRYWSRAPGLFVDVNGNELGAASAAPDFTGTVSEWYETLVETINDVSAQIHRKTLRGGANFVVTSPEVANILEFTAGFRASVTHDDEKGSIGALRVGSLSKKFDIIVDPYFPRNVLLVGRRGASFLESGYVYAPYVPLQTTPTIFGPEDFVPRKGVMTRYAKKMVRPDMYGLVIVRGLLGEQGAS
jgi:hypothetical protein